MKLETIKVRTWNGVEEYPVWREKDFAIREFISTPGCEIIHVASGFAIPARFMSKDHATGPMRAIQELRSDWDTLDLSAVIPSLAFLIEVIVKRHNGLWIPVKDQKMQNMAAKVYDTSLNRGPVQ